MAHKFIINDGDLILGDVEFHEELVCKGRERNKTVGGGRWYFNKIANTIYFWGKSVDFGQASKEQFDDSFKQPSVERATIVFSNKENLLDVMKEIEENCNKSE